MHSIDDDMLPMFIILLAFLVHLISEQNTVLIIGVLSDILQDRVHKIHNFVEHTVPQLLPFAFRRFFRMNPPTLNRLIQFVLGCERMHRRRKNRLSIPLWKKVYMTVAYLGSMSTTQQLSCLFGVSEDAFIRATDDVMLSLVDNIQLFIRWPNKEDYPRIAQNFQAVGRYFPNVIGCLDGCHLEFAVSTKHRHWYRNYKGYNSINLMAIVTYNMSFLDIFVGWPGRSHDSRVFKESPIYNCLSGLMNIPDLLPLETYSILADKAFPLTQEIMTLYRGQPNKLTPAERKFNRHMNSKRQTVERAFSLLKRRFCRLHYLNQKSHARAVLVTMASCILHNFCIGEDDNIEYYLTNVTWHRPLNIMNTPQMHLATPENRERGVEKRNIITTVLRRQ